MANYQFRLNADEIATRLDFFGFAPEDAGRIRRYGSWLEEQTDEIATELYAHIQRLPALGAILDGHVLQCRVKQSSYLRTLLGASVDETYVTTRAWVGEVHRVLGVEPQWYIAAFSHLQGLLLERLTEHPELRVDGRELLRVARSLTKLVMLDMSIAIEAYVSAELDSRGAERRVLAELAAPALLEVWEGIVVSPVVGGLDAARAEACRGALFQALADERIRAVVLDLTRLPDLDAGTGHHVFRSARELLELGVLVRVAGVRGSLERASARLGIDTSGVISAPTLRAAVQELVLELEALG